MRVSGWGMRIRGGGLGCDFTGDVCLLLDYRRVPTICWSIWDTLHRYLYYLVSLD
jgi:hypothetical protein